MQRAILFFLLLTFSLCLVTTAGCGGCRSEEDVTAERKRLDLEKKKKKKPKPNFQSPGTAIMPGLFPEREQKTVEELAELTPLERKQYQSRSFVQRNLTKMGHWVTTATPVIGHNFDVQGRVDLKNIGLAAQQSGSQRIPGTDFSIVTSRPFTLSKGQWKTLQSSAFLVPRNGASTASLQLDFLPTSGGMPVFTSPMCVSRLMKGHQYHMILLTNRQQKMRFLKLTDSVRVNDTNTFADGRLPDSYFVVENMPEMPIPLPGNALHWTTIAYVIWDDLEPDDLDLDQQQALVDWLHFGGQLIISGPDSLEKLENSFLADYLPAQSQQRIEIESSSFDELNGFWSIPNARNRSETRRLTVTEGNPMIGVELKPHVDATFVDSTGDLVIERVVGRGRVVATAFSLGEPRIRSWPSFQTFFSGALLRRPARRFKRNKAEVLTYRWLDDGTSIFDPLIGSSLRFTSRDLSGSGAQINPTDGNEIAGEIAEAQEADDGDDEFDVADFSITAGTVGGYDEGMLELAIPSSLPKRNAENSRLFGGYGADPAAGVAGWSDYGAIATAARSTLKSAAGITPPSAEFVLKMLGVYLLVLVPLNWFIFRSMGKVEWAWIAIPIISIAGAISVVRMASLDIGFARSNTQVGLLELHPGYQRGHLSQYSALYTSLSTKYDVKLDNTTGIALPFPTGNRGQLKDQVIIPVTLQQSVTSRLENFLIQSNSTRLMHTECFFDAGGSFSLTSGGDDFAGELEIENATTVSVNSASVIGRSEDGSYYCCQLGDVPAGSARAATWKPCMITDLVELWHEKESAKLADEDETAVSTSTVSASKLLKAVVEHLTLGRGEIRLLGYCDDRVSQTQFVPESTQTREQTLVLAHLRPALLKPIKRDANSVSDFLNKRAIIDEDSTIDEDIFSADE